MSERACPFILYRIAGDDCEIVVLYSLVESKGVGGRLIDAFKITQRIKGMGDGEIPGIDGIPILREFEFEIIL